MNAVAEILELLSFGSGEGRIQVKPLLRECGVARNHLFPIQSLPAPEGKLTERNECMYGQVAALGDGFRRLPRALQIAAENVGQGKSPEPAVQVGKLSAVPAR